MITMVSEMASATSPTKTATTTTTRRTSPNKSPPKSPTNGSSHSPKRRTRIIHNSCRRPVLMARFLLLFLISVACITIYSRILMSQGRYVVPQQHDEEIVPIEVHRHEQAANQQLLAKNESLPLQQSNVTRSMVRPRVLILDNTTRALHNHTAFSSRIVPHMRSTNNNHTKPSFIFRYQRPFFRDCQPMHEWQTRFHPTCNSLHEMDVTPSSSSRDVADTNNSIHLLNVSGSWRMVWKVPVQRQKEENNDNNTTNGDDLVALKMLHYHRDYETESYQHAIVDAIAMERLTKSPRVVSAYGFCGQSIVTEWAPGSARTVLKNETMKYLNRVGMARDLALGLHEIHYISSNENKTEHATFCHNDINIANMVQSHEGRVKYNDFNIGVLLRWNASSSRPCGFPVDFASPVWRAPEEIHNHTYVSEKIDIYSLGNVIFQILTRHEPWNHLEPDGPPTVDQVEAKKAKGGLPHLPSYLANSTKLEKVALRTAYKACFQLNPEDRPTALQLARGFDQVIRWKMAQEKATEEQLRELFHLVV